MTWVADVLAARHEQTGLDYPESLAASISSRLSGSVSRETNVYRIERAILDYERSQGYFDPEYSEAR